MEKDAEIFQNRQILSRVPSSGNVDTPAVDSYSIFSFHFTTK
jgi:hypothetical protein